MNLGPEKTPTAASDDEMNVPPTALQQAIRQRALDAIAEQQSIPPAPLSRRLLIIGLTLLAVLVFVIAINFVVSGMQRIMDTWYPGSISGKGAQPVSAEPPPLGPDQPFYISVDPPLEKAAPGDRTTDANSSAASDAGRR